MNILIYDIEKKIENIFEIYFAYKLLKLVSGSKPGYDFLNAESNIGVTFDAIVAYAHEKKKHSGFCFNHYSLSFLWR